MTGARLNLQRYIPALLTFTSNTLSRGTARLYKKLFGISHAEWRIIALLAVEPFISAQRICVVIGLDKALVSRTLRFLHTKKLIKISDDGRRRTIALTPKGTILHDKIVKVALEREKQLLKGLSKPDHETLIRLLHFLLRRAHEVNKKTIS